MNKKSILITGGAGFIGSNIARHFLNKNWRITVFDNLSTGKLLNIDEFKKNKNFSFIQGDIRDYKLLDKVLSKQKPIYISHHAALISVEESMKNPLLTNEINVTGTLNILEAALKNKVRKVLMASSSAVYGDSALRLQNENVDPNPISSYGLSKYVGEQYLKLFYERYGLETVSLRYFNVYGGNQNPNGDYAAVIPKFFELAKNNKDLTIFGDGLQTRDFIHVDDVVVANELALTKKESSGQIYNIASGQPTKILDLAKLIIKLTGSKSQIKFTNKRPGDIRNSVADISLANKQLAFKPSCLIKIGLGKMPFG